MENHFEIEKKLELMQQVRSRYDRDRNDLAHREFILYGKTDQAGDIAVSGMPQAQEEPPVSTFMLRILLSAGLFLLLIICDLSGENFFGIPTEQCFHALSKDYESSITQWVNAASHVNTTNTADTNGSPAP